MANAATSEEICHSNGDTSTSEESLFQAVIKNDLDTATHLISMGGVDINQTNSAYKTLLYLAIDNENVPMVKLLMNNGVDVNQASYCHMYCTYETPIVTAARVERMELLEMLLESGDDSASSAHKEGKSALQWASSYGNLTMAKLLLSRGADINWIGPFFHTALHYATIADKDSMVKWLLENGAEININGEGRSPLHIAAVRGNLAIVEHLVKHNCEVEIKDNFNFTPFSLACLRGHIKVIQYLFSHAKKGTEFDLDDGLQKAAECGQFPVLELLLKKGATVNSTNIQGETALSIAARGHIKAVLLLLENGANINTVDLRGYTPLQLSLLREQVDISALLIRHGAYQHTKSSNTDSPLQSAYKIADPILIEFLFESGCKLEKESWFSAKLATDRIQELDYHGLMLPRFWQNQNTNFLKDKWLAIIAKLQQPRSLLEICRVSIREHMVGVTQGTSVMKKLSILPLPCSMKRYLALEDIIPLDVSSNNGS